MAELMSSRDGSILSSVSTDTSRHPVLLFAFTAGTDFRATAISGNADWVFVGGGSSLSKKYPH